MVIHAVYNAGTLKKLINMVHHMHNTTTTNERLFTGTLSTALTWYVNKK